MKEQEWMDAGTNEKILREKHKKTYGNNWFSPEAYINLDVLKEEYRILSKKYHPDNNLGAKNIYLEIQAERNKIYESLKTN